MRDVVAFHPGTKRLVHIEPSMDAQSWAKRDERFHRKFEAGRRHIPELFKGLELPEVVEQIALLGFASKQNRTSIGGGKLLLVDELLREIFTSLKDRRIASSAVPEDKPILRTLQYVAEHRRVVAEVLDSAH